jgi:hypothetical protein
MTREILHDLEQGAMDALRTYAALITMPFTLAKSVAVTVRKALHRF